MIDANPYASPLAYDLPDKPAYRPSRVAGWICWALRGGNHSARRDNATGELVLRHGRAFRWLLWAITLGGPLVIGAIAIVDAPRPDEWWAPWLISVVCAFGGACGLLADERVFISATTIRKVGPFFFRPTLRWESITMLDFDESGTVLLRSANGKRLSVSADLAGVVDLPDALDRHLPAALSRDNEARLAIYRRFIGPPRVMD